MGDPRRHDHIIQSCQSLLSESSQYVKKKKKKKGIVLSLLSNLQKQMPDVVKGTLCWDISQSKSAPASVRGDEEAQ